MSNFELAMAAITMTAVVSVGACRSPADADPKRAGVPATGSAPAGNDEAVSPEPEQAADRASLEPDLFPLGQPDARLKVKPPAPMKYNKAKRAYDAKDLQTARTLLDEALEADPHFTWALLLRARIHLGDGEKDECLAMLERLAASNYMQYAPRFEKLGWLKPLRADPERWPAFEEKLERYRQAWIAALEGPGAYFVQSQYRKVEQLDAGGDPVDLKWRRGSVMFWSRDLGRFLVLGDMTDVAGFLVDRKAGKLVVVRFDPHTDMAPGLMGLLSVQRIDLTRLVVEDKPVVLASEAQLARFALGDEGTLLFEMKLPESGVADDEVSEEEPDDELVLGEADEGADTAEAEEVSGEADEGARAGEGEDEADEGEDGGDVEQGKSEADEGESVDAVDWEKDLVVEATLPDEFEWQLLVKLDLTEGPAPASSPEASGDPPEVRHGACFYLDEADAFCFAPTKKGGTWANLELRAPDAQPSILTTEPIPLVQF